MDINPGIRQISYDRTTRLSLAFGHLNEWPGGTGSSRFGIGHENRTLQTNGIRGEVESKEHEKRNQFIQPNVSLCLELRDCTLKISILPTWFRVHHQIYQIRLFHPGSQTMKPKHKLRQTRYHLVSVQDKGNRLWCLWSCGCCDRQRVDFWRSARCSARYVASPPVHRMLSLQLTYLVPLLSVSFVAQTDGFRIAILNASMWNHLPKARFLLPNNLILPHQTRLTTEPRWPRDYAERAASTARDPSVQYSYYDPTMDINAGRRFTVFLSIEPSSLVLSHLITLSTSS